MESWDQFEGMLEDQPGKPARIPVGKHRADVKEAELADDLSRIKVVFTFPNVKNATRTNFMYLKSAKGDEQTKKALNMTVKQLRNAGFKIANPSDIQRVVEGLPNKSLIVSVTNRQGSDYQNFWIDGVAPRTTEPLIDDSLDGDVPF